VSSPAQPLVAALDHVQVAAPAGCEDDARRFFGLVLGLQEVVKPAGLATRGGCWFRVGAQEIHVGVVADHVPAVKAHPGLRVASVADLEALARRLTRAGSPVEWADDDEIPGVRRLHTADPWGNRIELLADA
jgi:catechol 2,3-dioxygenase-like lactoylglutathione lyase family enzyme